MYSLTLLFRCDALDIAYLYTCKCNEQFFCDHSHYNLDLRREDNFVIFIIRIIKIVVTVKTVVLQLFFSGKWFATLKTGMKDSLLSYFTEIYDGRVHFKTNLAGGFDIKAGIAIFYASLSTIPHFYRTNNS